MATSDNELVTETRQFTGYTSTDTFTDSEIKNIIGIAKDEIRSDLGLPDLQFYQPDSGSYQADRALFWFTCIGIKVRAGEIGSVDLNIDDILESTDSENEYSFWFAQFKKRLRAAGNRLANDPGAASTTISRTDRTYEYERP